MKTSESVLVAVDGQPSGVDRTPLYGERLLFVCGLLAAVVFITVGIERSIWQDEAATILISNRPFRGVTEGLRHENNFPLYFYLVSIWTRLVGSSEVALRTLSALFYGTTIGTGFALGKRLCHNNRAAWYAAFFCLVSPLAVLQAQSIRMYSLLGTLCGLSLLAFVRLFWERDRSLAATAGFIVVNALGILTHLWFGFVLVGQAAALLVWERQQLWRWMSACAAAAVPFLVLWAPKLPDQIRNGATDWMPGLKPGALLVAGLEFWGLIPGVMLYGLAAGGWLMAGADRRKRMLSGRAVPLLALVFAVNLGLPLAVSLVRPIYAPGRYAIIALVPLAVLMAAILTSLWPRGALPWPCLVLLAVGVVNQVNHREDVLASELPAGQSDRTTALFLLQHAAPGDAIVFTSLTRPAADYYFRRAHAEDRFVEISFPAENARHPGWDDPGVPAGQRIPLQAEAAATTGRLQQIAGSGRRVWLYNGGSNAVGVILKQRLDAALALQQTYPLLGPYHRRILEYTAAGAVHP
ncbi:MAG: glycosyltransferase family 39 protein [Acidobacteriia bacterium]|nr:glycosyltransferase family 39 protein [Terriglobia bacterium]